MVLLALLGACSIAMLRPAHSLDKLSASGNLGVLVDPAFSPELSGCFDPASGGVCQLPAQSPLDLEYRLGLGRGFELGARGLLPPRALSLKYAFLDERRHRTSVSLAVQVEAGAQVTVDDGPLAPFPVALVPFARGDLLASGTSRLGPNMQFRPVGSVGWWVESRGAPTPDQGLGWTAGVFLPVRIPGGFAVAPVVGVSGWFPARHVTEVYARFGLAIEPWLDRPGPRIPAAP
ncbi:hypothetical protein LBMAG42_28840 [Deltaproteobacteria bacterium]|nr:hypothetical protein LBMAG42_28840 [Deltaproteobacteria bacterium]